MPSREVRLLLVDDDPSAIQVMSRMLEQYPDKRFATSGEAALRLAREAPPDLIVLDVDMPGMTGFDVCVALKADPALAGVPVIFATSHDATALLQVAAFQKGAADFITKPLVAAQLTARVRAQLRNKLLIEESKRDGVGSAALRLVAGAPTPRLLIVDDDTASIHILRHTLASLGELHFAKTGEEALALARRLVPDLILLDAHMPGIDGFDVCRSLKAEAPFRHVPIVFVTRFSDAKYEMRALDLGAADFIAKPYTGAVLQARVRNLLDLKQRTYAELQAAREHWQRVSDARMADIVGAASDAIVTYNVDDEVVLINAAACRMFGLEHDQAMGAPAQKLLGMDGSNEDCWRGDRVRTTLTRAGGSRFPAEVSVSRVGDGTDRLTTVMIRDTGDRERLEAESRSRIAAETASRTKTLMMAYIAHEMGNPLNIMMGFAQLMSTDPDHPLEVEQAKRLQHVMSGGRQLEGIMRDVMDLGRFEAGKVSIDLRPIDAFRCVEDAAQAVAVLADEAGLTLTVLPPAQPIRVTADAARLHQCLLNLLTNAIKYNRASGSVRIEVTSDSKEVSIAVHDTGPGMDALQCQHLFEPFNRLGRQRAAIPGAGLGLVITRQLVEAMNGLLRVESEPGLGSCFTIVLPEASETDAPATDAPAVGEGRHD